MAGRCIECIESNIVLLDGESVTPEQVCCPNENFGSFQPNQIFLKFVINNKNAKRKHRQKNRPIYRILAYPIIKYLNIL